jgi:ubiquinone/menaquinone biosynthesis C-methylase UbiE
MSKWWDQHVVPRLIGCACSSPPIMKHRAMVIPAAQGDVLELGAGGGINAAFYDPSRITRLTGIDPSPPLLDRAKQAWAIGTVRGDIIHGYAEDLPFESGRFDTVVTTFTLCSVNDQAKALREARRVLKPGGQLLFLEHGRAPEAGPRGWQTRLEPLWKRMAGNCHLTRPVADAVTAAGFDLTARDGHYLKKTPRFVGWVEWGRAVPA